jgi:hypothetical protein
VYGTTTGKRAMWVYIEEKFTKGMSFVRDCEWIAGVKGKYWCHLPITHRLVTGEWILKSELGCGIWKPE